MLIILNIQNIILFRRIDDLIGKRELEAYCSANIEWNEDNTFICLSGTAREAFVFGPNLRIHKNFKISVGVNRLEIYDQVQNLGFEESPLMLLYHFKYGYPFLDENCKIYCNYDRITVLMGIPKSIIYVVVIGIVLTFFTTKTVVGRNLYALGRNR